MPKKVTLKDIAAKAGLSPASVSMILNRRSIDRFNAETVEQVYAIAAELGYKSNKEKALNPDLWQKLLDEMKRHEVEFHWVKGHDGHPENERCDTLATTAAAQSNLPEDTGYRN